MAKKTTINTASKGLRKLARQFPQWAAQALNEEAEETMAAAKALTPVSGTAFTEAAKKKKQIGGRLKKSGRVHLATAKDLLALLTFSTDYAVYVHEIPAPPAKSEGGRSARHAPPTQWKYLETPVYERAPMFAQRIGDDIKRKLAASGGS